MASRAQRWGSKYGAAQRVTLPTPTAADLAATVYTVMFQSLDSGVGTIERVLAFDEAQAITFAEMRVRGRRGDERLRVTAEPMAVGNADIAAAILAFETVEEWQQRQDRYQP